MSGSSARLLIILDAQDKTRGAFSGVENALRGLGTSGKSAGQSLGTLDTATSRAGGALGDLSSKAARSFAQMSAMAEANARAAGSMTTVAAATTRLAETEQVATGAATRLAAAQTMVGGANERAAASTTTLGGALRSAGSALGSMAADAAKVGVVVGGTLVAGLTAVVNQAANFEQGMSAVKAASGAGATEMARLSSTALALGSDVTLAGIDATDAARAMTELAKGGVSVADQLGGATKGALLLASAGAISVGEAAGIATKAMNIFGLSGADVAHVADLMSAGANKSATDVGQLGAAFNQSAAVAKNAGLSIEELTGTLAFLAQRGIEGSDAGTSLKTALLALQAPTQTAAKTMDDLGINVRNANGEMLPFADIADVLKDRLSGLSDAQRDAALKTIFGNDAIRVGIALYEGGGSAIRDWTKNVNDAGSAARTGATLNDNLKGSISQLGATVQTAAISFGTALIPTIRTATDGLAKFVEQATKSPQAQAALAAFAADAASALQQLIAKVSDPTFQAGLKQWATAFLDVGKAAIEVARGVGDVLGPVLEAVGLLFGALDNDGRRNVVMFGLAAAAALRYGSALNSLASALPGLIAKVGALDVSLAGLGTAAAVGGALLIPLAVFAGNVANDMNAADVATQKVAKSLSGDLAPAIAKIQATRWEEALVALFTGHARAAEDAGAAVHVWAQGIGGAVPTLAELEAQLKTNADAMANSAGAGSAENEMRLKIAVALSQEIEARRKLLAAQDLAIKQQPIYDAYLTSEAQASIAAAAAIARHARTLDDFTQANERDLRVLGLRQLAIERTQRATSAAAAGLPEFGQNIDAVTNAWLIQTYAARRASDAFNALLVDQQGVAAQAGVYSGQLGLITGGMDRLNSALQSGIPLSAAQNIAYDQAAHAAAFYQVTLGGLANAQFNSALAAQQQVAAGLSAVHQAAVLAGASSDVAASLQGQAGRYLDLVAAVESANSALRVAAQEHSTLGSEISDFQGRVAALTQQEKDYAAGKAGVSALTAAEAAQLAQLKGLLPGLEEAYRAQAVQVTNLEVASVLANAAVLESQKAFQGQNQAVVASGVGLADAALKAGTLTQAQRDLAVAAITSAANAFDLTAAINSIPGQHVTKFVVDAAGAIELIDQYGKHLFDVPPQYTTKLQNNSSDLIPLVDQYGQAFLHVPADWVTNINNNAGEETPVVDIYGRTVASIPKEWATSFLHNAGEVIPVVNEYGQIVKLVPRDQTTQFIANTAGAQTAVNEFGQTIIKLPPTKTVTISANFDFVNKFDEFGQLMAGGGGPGTIPPVVIQVTANTAPAATSIAAITLDANNFGKLTPTAVAALTDNATPTLTTVKGYLGTYGATTATATAALLDNASGPLGGLIGTINSVPRVIGITASVDISGALGAIQTLRDNMPHSPAKEGPFRVLPDWTKVFDTFGTGVDSSIAALGRLGAATDGATADLQSKIAGAASAVAKAITDTLGAISALANFDFAKNSPSGATLGWFSFLTTSLVATIVDAAAGFKSEALKAAGDFADTAGKVAGFIKTALDAFGALSAYDFAKGSPTGSALGWFRFLVTSLVATIAEAAKDFDTVALKAASDFADSASKVTGFVKGALDAFAGLAKYAPPAVANIYAFGKTLRSLMNDFALVAEQVTQQAGDAAGKFATAILPVVDVVGKGLDAFTKLGTYVAPPVAAIYAFGKTLRAVINDLALLAEQVTQESADAAGKLASGAGAAVTLIGNGVAAFMALGSYTAPAVAAIYEFGKTLRAVINDLALVAEQVTQDAADAAAKFAGSAASVVALIGPAIEGLSKLADFVAPSRAAIDNLANAIFETVRRIGELASSMSQEGIKAAGEFGAAAGSVFNALKTALDVFVGMAKLVVPSRQAIDQFAIGIAATVAQLGIVADQIGRDGIKKAADFGASVQAVFGSLKSAMDMLTNLEKFKDVARKAFDSLLAGMQEAVQRAQGMVDQAKLIKLQSEEYAALMAQATVNFAKGLGVSGSPQEIGRKLGEGVISGAREAVGAHSPAEELAKLGRDITAGLVLGMTQTQQDAVKAAADLAKGVADAIQATLSAATALGKLDLTKLPTGGQITGLLGFTRALVAEMAASSTMLNEDGIKQTSLFSDAAQKVAGAVSASVTALTSLATYVAPAGRAIFDFGKSLRTAVADLAALADELGVALAEKAATFSEQATKAIAIFGSVSGFTALVGYVRPASKAIYDFGKDLMLAIGDLAAIVDLIGQEIADKAGKFGEVASKAVAVIGGGAEAFKKLTDYSRVTKGAIFAFGKDLRMLIEDFAAIVDLIGVEVANKAGQFADGAGKAVAVVGTALSSFSGLSTFVTPGKAAVDGLLATVKYIIARFGEMATTMSTEGTKQLGDFGAATNAVLGGVKAAIDTFIALDKAVVPRTGDLSDLVVAVRGVTSNMADAAKLLGDDAIKDATAFGTAAQGIFTALKSGLDLFIQIDKPGGWPTTDWLQPLIELMSGVLLRGGQLLTQSQQIKAIADQFSANLMQAGATFGGALGLGDWALTGNVGGGGTGASGGGGTVINNYYTVTGNTLLSKDTGTQQMVSSIVTATQGRTISYATSG